MALEIHHLQFHAMRCRMACLVSGETAGRRLAATGADTGEEG